MSDTPDIVKRLRDPSKGSPRWKDTMFEAADEIDRLRAERNMWRQENAKKQIACEQMGARIVALEAKAMKNERITTDFAEGFRVGFEVARTELGAAVEKALTNCGSIRKAMAEVEVPAPTRKEMA
jgi:hypothetical protein